MAEAAIQQPSAWGAETWRRLFSARNLIVLVVAAVIAYLALVPLGFLLWQTFARNGHLSLAAFREAYSHVGLTEMTKNSLVFALGKRVGNAFVDAIVADAKEQASRVILLQAGENVHD